MTASLIEALGVFAAWLTFIWSVWIAHEGKLREHNDRQAALHQSERELRWKQTVEAQATIRRLTDNNDAKNAMIILDWNGRRFELRNGEVEQVRWEAMRIALRTTPGRFLPIEVFVRDAFDSLFDKFEMIQQQIDNGLFLESDVRYPIAYYSTRMMKEINWSIFENYLVKYDYPGAKKLVQKTADINAINDEETEAARLIDEEDEKRHKECDS